MKSEDHDLRNFTIEILDSYECAEQRSLFEFIDMQLKSAEKMTKATPAQQAIAEPKKETEKSGKLMFKAPKPAAAAIQKASKGDKPADNPEKIAMLQSANKNFKNSVVMSKNVSNDLKRWMSKMPSDKMSIMKKTANQYLSPFKKDIGKYYLKFATAFPNDDLMAKVTLMGFIAQVLQDLEKESQ